MRQSRQEHLGALGLSLIYAFADIGVLTNLVRTIEELLDLSRQLFGTLAWFDQSSTEMASMMSMHEVRRGALAGSMMETDIYCTCNYKPTICIHC